MAQSQSRDSLLIDAIHYYKKSLERHTKTGNVEELLYAFKKLSRLPIKLHDLEETGVGNDVSEVLKKFQVGPVKEIGESLLDKWTDIAMREVIEIMRERVRLVVQEMYGEEDEPGENELPREE